MATERSRQMIETQAKKVQTAKKALRESEEIYRILVEQTDDAILILQEGQAVYRNPKWTQLLGYTVEETAQRSFWDFILEEDRHKVVGYYQDRLKGLPAPEQYELRVTTRSGEILTMEARPCIISLGGQPATMVIMRDLTERRKAEQALRSYHEKLRSMAVQLSLTEERERRRISGYVHDHMGQNLAFAKMKLVDLRKQIAQPELKGKVQDVCGLMDDAIHDTRCLVSELGSPVFYELGFVPAVKAMVAETQQKHDISLTFNQNGILNFPSQDIQVLIYQAIRELLANMVKHSGARSGVVSIQTDEKQITISVEDNGHGFDTNSLNLFQLASGYGLFSIRERLDPIGGKVLVESEPGLGTRVMLTLPVERRS